MSVTKERKQELIKQFGEGDNDSGKADNPDDPDILRRKPPFLPGALLLTSGPYSPYSGPV